VFGEQSLRLLFREWMGETEAATAASDWAGDRLAVFADGTQTAVVWRLRFDSTLAAERAFLGFGRGVDAGKGTPKLSERAAAPKRPGKQERRCAERPARGPFAVSRDGRELTVVLGAYARDGMGARAVTTCAQALAWAAGA
jgi:hypothetical protein